MSSTRSSSPNAKSACQTGPAQLAESPQRRVRYYRYVAQGQGILITVKRIIALAVLLVPAMFVSEPSQANAQPSAEPFNACLIAGNGANERPVLPNSRPTVEGLKFVTGLDADAQGNVYVQNVGVPGSGVMRISSNGDASQVDTGAAGAITSQAGADFDISPLGDFWFTIRFERALTGYSAAGNDVDLTDLLPAGAIPTLLASGTDVLYVVGSVDIAPGPRQQQLYRIDDPLGESPSLTVLMQFDTMDGLGTRVDHIALAPDGVWVATFTPQSITNSFAIMQILDDGTVSTRVEVASVYEVDSDRNGALWYINRRTNGLFRLDPGGTAPITVIENVSGLQGGGRTLTPPEHIAISDETIWIANSPSFGAGFQVYGLSSDPCTSPLPYRPGPTTCSVLDATDVVAGPAARFDAVEPLDLAVDGSSVLHSTWVLADAEGFLEAAMVRTDQTGAHRVLGTRSDLIAGTQFGFDSIAVSETTGAVFASGPLAGEPVILRNTPTETWNPVVTKDLFANEPRSFSNLSMTDNATLAFGTTDAGFGPIRSRIHQWRGDNGVTTVADSLDVVFDLSPAPGNSGNLDVWVAGVQTLPGNRTLLRVGATTDVVLDLPNVDLNGTRPVNVEAIAVRQGAVTMSVQIESGLHRIVRLEANGTITSIIDELMLIDGLIIDEVAALDVGPNGDLYIADSGNARIVRLPASGDCATPFPPLVDVAASVNCDDQANVIDALFIVQYEVGVREAAYQCPLANPETQLNVTLADVSGDGAVNVIDALFIAQCDVGVPNRACPAG